MSSGSRPGRREAAGRHFCLGAYFQLSEGPKSRFSTDIESLYTGLDKQLAQRTLHFIHCTLGACIGAAVRSRKLARSPISDMAVMPSPGVGEHGKALEPDQPEALLRGFRGTVYFPIVAVAAFTGARRSSGASLERSRRYRQDLADRARHRADGSPWPDDQAAEDQTRLPRDHD